MRSDREERIRRRAYAIWQSEGHAHGRHEDHWHRAEREIAAEEAGASKGPASKGPGRDAAGSGKPPTEKSATAGPARRRNGDASAPVQKQASPRARSIRARKSAED